MEHDEIKKNCISGCAAEKKAETCGGKQNSKRKKTDVIDIAQQLKNEKKIRTYFTLVVFIILTCTLIIAMSLTFVLYRLGIWTAQRSEYSRCLQAFRFEPAARHCNNGDTFRKHCAPG